MRLGAGLLLLIFFLSLLSGCNNKDHLQKAKKQVEQIKAQPAKSIESFSVVKPMEKTIYKAHKFRSPFSPPQKTSQISNAPNLNRKKQPLEVFSLDSLKMVGTIKQGGKLWGLVQSPNGNIYPVSVGTYLGRNYGEITKVLPDAIKILEKVQVNGQWESQITRMTLK